MSLTAVDFGPRDAGRPMDLMPGPYVQMMVRDTGPGMNPATRERIFEPYFTTKKQGEGTGLGLAVVHGIVKSYSGWITVDSEVGKGTTFKVFFPRLKEDSGFEATPVKPLARGQETILLVDDEPGVLDTVDRMLRYLGYKVISRTNGLEALQAFRVRPAKFDLVITDQTMPQMRGMILAQEIHTLRPEIPIILCTGFGESAAVEQMDLPGIRRILMKPVLMKDMAAAVRDLLDQAEGNRESRT